MTDGAAGLPISLIYNLNRLGQAGDEIAFAASEDERAALARHVDALGVSKFEARILLKKAGPNRFSVSFELTAEVTQACVVTLEPLVARIQRDFTRELHFLPGLHRVEKDLTIAPEDDDVPEEIGSLHYDLGVPLVEEFVLSIDPYPRAPGVEFQPPVEEADKPESPFAVLKTLKSPPKSRK